jgi:hypothetical protein
MGLIGGNMVVKFPVSPSARARLRRRANPSPAAVRKPRQRSECELEWFRTFGPRLRATRLALGMTEAEAAAVARTTVRTWRRREAGRPGRQWHYELYLFVTAYDLSYTG